MTTEVATPRHYTAADIPAGVRRSADGLINRHGLRLIRQFEGPPRLKARICEGGRYELGPGVTFHLDGAPVMKGETCDEDYAEALFAHAVRTFCMVVDKHVHVELNSNKYAALVALAYNIGEYNFAYSGADRMGSSVLKRTNAREYDGAAEAFGMWLYATKDGHKQALRGLLRRRYAEACLYIGCDWEVACSDDAVALVRERPPNDIGTDKVLSKTPFRDVRVVAERYPLPADDELVLTQPASPRVPAVEAAQRQVAPARTSAAGAAATKPVAASPATAPAARAGVPPLSPPPVPAPVPAKVAPPPLPKDAAPASLEPKDMVLSKRFWGLTVTALGTTNLLPQAAQTWVSNEGNRELITWLIVVLIGFALYKYGQHKAKRPLK